MVERKIRVVLVCAAGMSSSLIEEKLKQAALAAGEDMELKAVDSTRMSLWDYDRDRMDIILVAPQVRFKKKSILEKAGPLGILVQDIEPVAYGMVDGELIFQQVMSALRK